jgi:predicted MFS family arabinose efflux permease
LKFAGGVAYIIAFDRITTSSGFPWAVRVMGFISLAIALLAIPTLLYGTSSLAKARSARKLWDMSAFKDVNFLIFTACSASTFFGYIVPYFYIASFAQDTLGIPRNTALYILIGAISASFFGRLSAGLIAHRLGPLFTWFWCTASSAIVSFSWIAVHSQSGLIIIGIFWGFCSAGLVTLPAAVFPSLCPDQRRLGTRTGMSWGLSSFASLTGPPIAGALLGHKKSLAGQQPRSEYLGPQLWAGCCLSVGACIIFSLWLKRVKQSKTGMFV